MSHGFDERIVEKPDAKTFFSEEDYRWIEGVANGQNANDDDEGFDIEGTLLACAALAKALLANDPKAFEDLLEQDAATCYRYSSPTFARLVIIGLEYGVACGDGACANWLGAMYYMGDVVEQAQPAIRIAKLISDPDYEEWGIPYSPMRALELYQLAERGLRIDIARGQTYYARRLKEAIDGQERMREVLDDPFVVL